jgi:WD40 repeat protein
MDEEEVEHISFSFHFHFIFIQWIWQWEDCHLDSAGFKGKDKNSQSTFSHICYVRSLSFSPDGRFLASEDHLGKLIIWTTEVNKKTERGSDHFGCNTIRIYSTLFQNWEPVYISEEEIRWGNRFSWLASSTDVPNYKLTFEFESRDGKV